MTKRSDEDLGAYRDYLMVTARSLVSVELRGRIDPSDLVHETLCEALRAEPRERDEGQALAWLRKILRDNLVDRFRRLNLERRVASLDALLDQTSAGMSRLARANSPGPESALARDEEGRLLDELLRRLTPPQAEAIILKHCQGMSVAEIGRHMNRTPDAVGGLLRHGMRRLRELMPKED